MTQREEEHVDILPEIPGYRLLRKASQGGMSTIYLAQQVALEREVAIKVMRPEALADEVSRRRFENEARTIARLDHPHIVQIYDVGHTRDGQFYYSMPYLPRGHVGQRQFARDGSTDEASIISIARALLGALEYAHGRGVIHRDVKAENVLFDEHGRPLLVDFGIALRRGHGARVTTAGLAVGSTAYMAPEQARGEEVDGRVDLYALGVLIWEMLTGRLPYEAEDALSMAVKHVRDPIPRLPPHLAHWQPFMNKALAKDRDQRFQNAAQMRMALATVERRRRWVYLLPWRRPRSPGAARRWRWVAAAALLVWVVGGAVAWMALTPHQRNDFLRAGTADATPPPSDDPLDAMLAPPPEAPAKRAVAEAREHMARSNLTAPAEANAYISTLSAWHLDSADPDVRALIGDLANALTDEVTRHLRDGNEKRAKEYFDSARSLLLQTGSLDQPAHARLRSEVNKAVRARVQALAARQKVDFERVRTLARDFELGPEQTRKLLASAETATAKNGRTGDKGGTPRPAPGGFQLAARPVSRAEYARFAEATGRAPALCRERASLLRIVAPRNWRTPGFSQGDSEPVVCVSYADAEAYAEWYSQQTGHRYRLPSAIQARQSEPEISGRDISLWLRDCGADCVQRRALGTSWRSREEFRSLGAGRGYDDVGFRLVREN
ncbi:MAG TPA: bifunctional serine/threonine-protein kinase/formylglycine-generating enzyme family protein [Lysobacter sp.]|nr:bifunctional serine/threonine-protein kinase/formylglycine-generating enzyme family protein [Lysobacter sp.]